MSWVWGEDDLIHIDIRVEMIHKSKWVLQDGDYRIKAEQAKDKTLEDRGKDGKEVIKITCSKEKNYKK